MLGILSALEEENRLLLTKLVSPAVTEYARVQFTSGQLADTPVVMANTKVGKVNAAIVTQLLIDRFNVDTIILMGLGGGTGPEIEVGDIVISKDVVHHDVDATGYMDIELGEIPFLGIKYFPADERLIRTAEQAARKITGIKKTQSNESAAGYNPRIVIGRVMTGDQFINSMEKVRWLWETFRGHCVEMEGAAVAQCAYLNDIPFVIIRAISDKCDELAEKSYHSYLQSEAPELLADVAVRMAEELTKP